MYTPTQSSFGTFGRNEDKGDMTNGMFFFKWILDVKFELLEKINENQFHVRSSVSFFVNQTVNVLSNNFELNLYCLT